MPVIPAGYRLAWQDFPQMVRLSNRVLLSSIFHRTVASDWLSLRLVLGWISLEIFQVSFMFNNRGKENPVEKEIDSEGKGVTTEHMWCRKDFIVSR